MEEENLKNDSGMIEYVDSNIEAVCSYLFGNEYDSPSKRKAVLKKWRGVAK